MAATKEKELSVEERLNQLWNLQQIDTKVDKIKILKGELPEEVQILEDVITGLNVRLTNLNEELAELDEEMANRKNAKAMAKELDHPL
jgi:predicted  nucleic acid-binding Zn-ribbon protein